MRIKKIMTTVFTSAFAIAVVLLATPPIQASAASGTHNAPNGRGSGYYHVDYTNNNLALSATALTLQAGYCVTTYLDIVRQPNVPAGSDTHYDIRAARTCQSNTARSSSMQYEGSTYGINITGINRLAVCYGPINTIGTCNYIIGDLTGVDEDFNTHNMCSRAWTKASNGDIFYFGAGDPTDCDN
jgi:hypothetical protein